MKIHIVQKGDTLWKIAKKYGVNFEELKKMNAQLSNPDMIMPGMKIKVPTAGGTVKKEAPIAGGTPQAKINMGGKKEMPIAKEKPMPMPEVKKEVPKEAPVKEQPKMEMPKPVPKEEPVKPYKPKMPVQIKPEIDINNYYMMNMANMQLPPQPKPQPKPQLKPQPKPQLPPKPDNIFPEVKPEIKPEVKAPVKQQIKPQVKPEVKPQLPKAEMKPNVKSEIKPDIKIEKNDFMDESPSMMPFVQGGYQQPMIPYPYNCYPGAPSMTGPAYGHQGQQMPYPQVQGMSQYPGMMPNMALPAEDMESSSFAQMPLSPTMGGNMPHHTAPQMTGPVFHGVPISPVMPGPGCIPEQGYSHQMPYMPQVAGAMDDQMPLQPQVGGMMDNQMPQVGGMMDDESSEMPMPQMPQVGGMMNNQMPQVGGMMQGQMPMMPQVGGMMENNQMPQVGGMMADQMPYQMQPQVGGMMQGQMPHQMPQVGGMMQGQMPHQMPQVGGMMQGQMPMMPQVGGMMENNQMPQVGGMMQDQMPMMPQVGGMMDNQMPQVGGIMQDQMPMMPQVGGMMDNQMPQVGGMMQPPMMPKQAVKGAGNDCGCGGQMGNPYGMMGAGMHHPHHMMHYPQHMMHYPQHMMHHGFAGAPGMHPQMGMGQQGFMNPYGAGPMGGGYGMPMPRFDDEESNEY
ncbi:SafA/ExsA family spore coat assembly protein [Mesobacillus subterraneus]|uniref:SafA/ExsA family spore coat assembly protein n=1 Tax=Mesobacillus subterraneus TaxID=285983 RepID=UPI003341184F